ncbi:hypothetical protein CUJ84_Chr002318 [Rhizobium leguminosarum]|uniref:Uncharacterized protein n=1 Tax=Rhizobium leguminosarum TaxID=384 RepID=A0A2K9Z393_RHILE|nr:hypothetical protein CUJ84_Chr002318 [Rhizobium leguminosarum]
MGRKSNNQHGHSHGRLKPLPRQYDVGVDGQGLRPVALELLLKRGSRARYAGRPVHRREGPALEKVEPSFAGGRAETPGV